MKAKNTKRMMIMMHEVVRYMDTYCEIVYAILYICMVIYNSCTAPRICSCVCVCVCVSVCLCVCVCICFCVC